MAQEERRRVVPVAKGSSPSLLEHAKVRRNLSNFPLPEDLDATAIQGKRSWAGDVPR
jgi:hypothetical protein